CTEGGAHKLAHATKKKGVVFVEMHGMNGRFGSLASLRSMQKIAVELSPIRGVHLWPPNLRERFAEFHDGNIIPCFLRCHTEENRLPAVPLPILRETANIEDSEILPAPHNSVPGFGIV